LDYTLENRQVSVTGEVRHMLWTLALQRDDSGEVIGANSIARDITERRLAEKEKTELEDQLRQSQKLEAIGQLAGGVAHDFNNLLTAILGHAQLALLRMTKDNLAYHDLQEIEDAANRAADLTQQLLAFSRKQLLQPKALDINQTLSGMNKMLRILIREDIQLEARSELHLWPIMADPGQMEQVIVNLVVNASDAMPAGGKITIETSNIALGDDSPHGAEDMKPGPFVMLSVTDTGHGMSEETRNHIFEPFYTTKPEGEGTGLGLATVHGIVKQHGGDILIESEEGLGTTFRMYFPASMKDVEKEPTERKTPPMPRGSEAILFVEDEDSVRNLGVEVLTDLGYSVIEAPNGPHAMKLLEENNLVPDLLVTDVVMPGMSGEELARRYRSKFPDGKVLFTSGYTDHALQKDGMLKPGVELLRKPFTPSTLAGEVRRMLDK
jgi:signal transduction histidine kinase